MASSFCLAMAVGLAGGFDGASASEPTSSVKEHHQIRTAGVPVRTQASRISINTLPMSRVEIDGRAVGVTPLINISVTPGKHQLVFRDINTGMVLERREVNVRRDQHLRLTVRL